MDTSGLVAEIAKLPSGTPAEQGLIGLLQGVAYSLRRAAELGFDARTEVVGGVDYTSQLGDAVAALELGREPSDFWMSGFFFNSAVIRIAAASHRAFRLLFRVDSGSFHNLADRAVNDGRVVEDDVALLRECYRDVNEFKHDADALLLSNRRVANLTQAAAAARQLVHLVKLAV